MRCRESPLACVFVVEPEADDRDHFARPFRGREFAARGLSARFPECKLSYAGFEESAHG
jgi:hypothetical protein